MTVTKEIIGHNKKEIFIKVITSVLFRGSLLVIPILYSSAIDNASLANYNRAIKFLLLTLFVTIFYYFMQHINNYAYYRLYDKLYRSYNWKIIKSTQSNSAYSLSRFSLGAPVPKELADIEIIYPYFIVCGDGNQGDILKVLSIRILEFFKNHKKYDVTDTEYDKKIN